MKIEMGNDDIDTILLLDLLELFELNLDLSPSLLNLEINSNFKKAHLNVQNNIYSFTINGSSLTIDIFNHNKTVIKSQDANPEGGLPFGSFCCYGWDGSITSIS